MSSKLDDKFSQGHFRRNLRKRFYDLQENTSNIFGNIQYIRQILHFRTVENIKHEKPLNFDSIFWTFS
jgi:hypothetical protein